MEKTIIYYRHNKETNELICVNENQEKQVFQNVDDRLLEHVKSITKKIKNINEKDGKLLVTYFTNGKGEKTIPFVNRNITRENLYKIQEEQEKTLPVKSDAKRVKVIKKQKNNNKKLAKILAITAMIALITGGLLGLKGCNKEQTEITIEEPDDESEIEKNKEFVFQNALELTNKLQKLGIFNEYGIEGLSVEQILNFWIVLNHSELDPEEFSFLYKNTLSSEKIIKDFETAVSYKALTSMFDGKDAMISEQLEANPDKKILGNLENEIKILTENLKNPSIKSEQEAKINSIFRSLYINKNSLDATTNYIIMNYIYELNAIMNVDKTVMELTVRLSLENCEDAVQNKYDISKENLKADFENWYENAGKYQELNNVDSLYDEIVQEITLKKDPVLEESMSIEENSLNQKTKEQQEIAKEANEKGSTTPKVVKETIKPVPTSGQTPKTEEQIKTENKIEENYWTAYKAGNDKGVADAMKDNILGNNSNYNPTAPANIVDKTTYSNRYKVAYNETKKTFSEEQKKLEEKENIVKIDEDTYVELEPGMGYDENGNPVYVGESVDPNMVIIDPEEGSINLGLEEETEGYQYTK